MSPLSGMALWKRSPKIQCVDTSRIGSPSAARSLSSDECGSLAATAAGLPPGWCATIEWDGQLAMTPVFGHRFSYGDWTANRFGRVGQIRYSSRYRLRPDRKNPQVPKHL